MRKLKAHHWFWITTAFLALVWITRYNPDDDTVVNANNSYFVVDNNSIIGLLMFLYLSAGGVYWLLYRTEIRLIPLLTKLHVFISVACIFVYHLGVNFIDKLSTNSDFPLFDDTSETNQFVTILVITGLSVQVVFIFNIIFSLIKDGIQRKHRKAN
ncbi:hypothetical protein [Winogradskyella sp. 3972H.M.0a.05]|uniref:hypothetical protein n=1 Tax=Winogradskyella sp. 3972H.M.0a.05 TaxID=2950277 RepID=UPI0033945BAC